MADPDLRRRPRRLSRPQGVHRPRRRPGLLRHGAPRSGLAGPRRRAPAASRSRRAPTSAASTTTPWWAARRPCASCSTRWAPTAWCSAATGRSCRGIPSPVTWVQGLKTLTAGREGQDPLAQSRVAAEAVAARCLSAAGARGRAVFQKFEDVGPVLGHQLGGGGSQQLSVALRGDGGARSLALCRDREHSLDLQRARRTGPGTWWPAPP